MASNISIQNSLSAGEISPSLWGRTDLDKWNKGCSTCRNFIADYRGGIFSRPGLKFIGQAKQAFSNTPPRLIPFQFNINQGYVLEFGDHYVRFIFQGGYVTEAGKTIQGITNANPGVLSFASPDGYSAGDWLSITGGTGLTQFNGLTWIVNTTPTSSTLTLKGLGGTVVDTTTWGTYTANSATAARVYTLISPYAVADLPYLKYTQSADVMSLTCVNTVTGTEYPPYDLARFGQTDWRFGPTAGMTLAETFAAVIQPPTNLAATAFSSSTLSTWYSYVVTAVDRVTGEESNPSSAVLVQNNDISIFVGSNNLRWTAVADAASYNVYATTPSYNYQISAGNLYGFIGTSQGTNFVDTNIIPDFTVVPPQHTNPFAPGAVTFVTVGGSQNGDYSQQTVGYSITTSTGTGFAGQPVVTNGFISGFVITNEGQNYVGGDGITFTDSGGGLAKGSYTFTVNGTVGNKIDFNGVLLLLQGENDASLGPYEVNIGSDLIYTLQSICTWLNVSQNPNIVPAFYTCDDTHIYVTYKTPGTDGNKYALNGVTGWAGVTVSGANLTGGGTAGSGATGSLTIGPATGVNPSVVAYFQQRRVYANTLNQPDTLFMSQPGLFTNMDSSIPVTAADAITATPFAQQVNGIQWLMPMPGGLVTLTGKGAWQINGGATAAVTPSTVFAAPQAYNGCNALVPPITVNYDILYVQEKGTIVRDLAYNFFVNIYTGTDLTLFSNHLFTGSYNTPYQIEQWAWAEEPFKTVWAIRNDGTLLCLTYLKEIGASWSGEGNSVYAWTRHDTDGIFISVASVTEPPVDAVYVVVQRFVFGSWRYYIERFDNRFWQNVEESFCVDAGLSTSGRFPIATLSPQAASGSAVHCLTDNSVFDSTFLNQILRVGGGIGTITSVNSGIDITVDFTQQSITNITPNDPNLLPLPANQLTNEWSVSAPVTAVYGLNHLLGKSVTILADGSVLPNQTVTANNGFVGITLPEPASIVTVGLPFTCQAQTLFMDKPGGQETVQTRRKTINAIGLRTEFTRGLQLGADQPDASAQQNYAPTTWTNMNEIKERNNLVSAGNAVPLFTGDVYKTVSAGWAVTGQLAFQQVYPLPAKILAAVAYWTQGDTLNGQ